MNSLLSHYKTLEKTKVNIPKYWSIRSNKELYEIFLNEKFLRCESLKAERFEITYIDEISDFKKYDKDFFHDREVIVLKQYDFEVSGYMNSFGSFLRKGYYEITAQYGIFNTKDAFDKYIIDKKSLHLVEKFCSTQKSLSTRVGKKFTRIDIDSFIKTKKKLKEKEMLALGKSIKSVNRIVEKPFSVSYGIINTKIYIFNLNFI